MNFRFTLNNSIEGEYILTKTPIGWQDTELAIKRSDTFKGLFYDFSLKLKFFCGGAGKEYIDNILDLYGVEAEVSILIEIDCLDSGDFETVYEGVLNLSSYEQTETAPQYTIVKIEQAGIEQTIVNRYDTTVNLSKLQTIDGTALTPFTYGPYLLNLHSKVIRYSSLLSFDEDILPDIKEASFNPELSAQLVSIFVNLNLNNISYDDIPGLLIPSDNSDSTYSGAADAPYLDPIFQNTGVASAAYTIVIEYTGSISGGWDNPTPGTFDLFLQYRKGTGHFRSESLSATTLETISLANVIPGAGDGYDVDMLISHTSPITLAAGEYLWVYIAAASFNLGSLNQVTGNLHTSDGFIKLYEDSTTISSTCNAFAIYEQGARILQSITNLEDPFRSDFFGRVNAQPYAAPVNGCGAFTAITNGFQIRSFPIADITIGSEAIQGRPIYSSLKDYFESLSAIYNLGLGVEKSGDNYYVRIEPIEYFFSTDVLFQIPNIKGLKIRNAEEFYVNGFEVGYDKWENEQVNGLDEVNTKREYIVKLKKTGTKISKVSKLIASPYAMEFTRRKQFIDGSTEDSQYDQENFIICLNRTVNGYTGVPTGLATAEKNENFTTISNLISPATTYNLRITPGRIVRNWFKTIAASVIKMNDTLKEVKFAFGQGNYKAISKGTDACDFANQATIDESADLEVVLPASDSKFEPIFENIFFELEAPLSFTQFNLIKANPTKCLEISTTDGNFIKAFIFDVRYKPVTGKATFILLKAYQPETDCSHIYVESGYVECDYVE